MTVSVRDALEDDAAAIRDVAEAAWHETYAGLLQAQTIDAFVAAAYSIGSVKRRIAEHTVLVAIDGDSVVAFADAAPLDDRLALAAIYARPDRRGEGIGTLLLAEFRARFPDPPIAADVLVGNRKGETFYERRGFAPRETIETELFGERVVERRWWLEPARAETGH